MAFQLNWDDWWGIYGQMEVGSKESIKPELKKIIDGAVGGIRNEMLKCAPNEYSIVEHEILDEELPEGYTEYEPPAFITSDRTPEQRHQDIKRITDRLDKEFKDAFGKKFDKNWLKRSYSLPKGIWHR